MYCTSVSHTRGMHVQWHTVVDQRALNSPARSEDCEVHALPELCHRTPPRRQKRLVQRCFLTAMNAVLSSQSGLVSRGVEH